ncbi:small subunit of soluble hydrogenase [Gloeomargarita lithophora Alchichica-D10]|uniref:Small subunit of soluble hydrogenase n=1 Tax=Gloeomargarita lithophora Alchichica-D10 TaxID=1188229 RepID=A0A1J0AES9_9CYAN|nr:alanine--glyoxylate aminotransferase family protein [Gloeomargarita lithophora]APB34423.1 small subunit of soluble hydrogenase [Gloeomargarita lithophora Alchichica-D10]
MTDRSLLLIPGPTLVPESVLQAMAQHPIGHRSGEFSTLMGEVTAGLQWLHQTTGDVLILTASGTGAMEAGIINFLSPGDRVLCGCNGKFGERWTELCQAFQLQVETITAPWGQPLNPNDFATKLTADRDKTIKAVIITHSETSTGVINDLEAINRHVKAHGQALIIVDAVTSLGATSVPVDDWGLDVVASGSQKGYMIPPGLGFVAVSERAWQASKTAKLPKFYFDLGSYRKDGAKNTTPFTPPVNLFFALRQSLQLMQKEGLPQIFTRHERSAGMVQAAVSAWNLPLLCPVESASPAVTAVAPTTIAAEEVRSLLKKQFGIAVAGGQDQLKGKIFRIGHLGFAGEREMLTVIAALESVLHQLGHPLTLGSGVGAAIRVLEATP